MGGLHIGSATLNSSGVATLTKNLNADAYPLTAVYGSDANNLPSTSGILNQVALQTHDLGHAHFVAEPVHARSGGDFHCDDFVADRGPDGTVTFTARKTVLGTAQLSSGKAKFSISTLAVGSTKVTATYYGNSNITKRSASVIQTVHQ